MDWLVVALIMLVPGAVGEGLARWPLARWPRWPIGIGAVLVLFVVVVTALAPVLCGLGDDVDDDCDRKAEVAGWMAIAGTIVVVLLAGLALVSPQSSARRYLLWATPLITLAAVAVSVT